MKTTTQFHEKPFDEATLVKLTLFENYAQAWLPVFLMAGFARELHIFDFFAGSGQDSKGTIGSPMRFLNKVIEQKELILKQRISIVLHFNEFDKKKVDFLRELVQQRISEEESEILKFVKINFYNEDFEVIYTKLKPLIAKNPSLVYFDQFGVKFLNKTILLELEKLRQVDFMYFLSSTHVSRFGNEPEFKKYLDLNIDEIRMARPSHVHRVICEQLNQNILPIASDLKLYPFSIKKGLNIHGVLFGAKHPRAIDKFLNLVWKLNSQNGDANFDIDNEASKGQIDLFEGVQLSKIESFKKEIRDKILSGAIKNNRDLLNFTFEKGHIGKHADECLREMKHKKEIRYDGISPLVTYDNVFKNNKIIHYEKI
jgi:three-Cys-motif partner protein